MRRPDTSNARHAQVRCLLRLPCLVDPGAPICHSGSLLRATIMSRNDVTSGDQGRSGDRPWTGRSIERVEDAALLSGRGRFIDDLGVQPGTLHAAILRSPHAHADILAIDAEAAKRLPGVAAVLTGEQVKAITSSLVVGVKAPVECCRSRSIACAMSASRWR